MTIITLFKALSSYFTAFMRVFFPLACEGPKINVPAPGWIARCLAAGLDPKTATKWQVEDELKDFEDLTPQGKKNRELSPSARKELNKKQQERYHEKKDPLWGVNPGARKGGRIRVPKKKPNV